jgi:tetratricopeptide (TPR) repeat protein
VGMNQKNLILSFTILLALIVITVFSPTLKAQFLNWDDYAHYISNPCVYSLSWYNFGTLFQQLVNDTYVPLTVLSFNLEYHLFGLSPVVSHLINILLHLATVLVIFNFALKLKFTPVASFIASLIFAVHPIHVESVAWVTERKDVLGILFYVLCLRQYWSYLEGQSHKNYGLSLFFALLSVLTKSMAVSLPWTLLLLDWFYQRPYSKKWWLDKLPFAFLVFPIAAITFFKLSPHPDVSHNSILVGIWAFSWYLEKFLLPFNLFPAYSPAVPVTIFNWIYIKSLIIFIVFISSMFVWRKNRLFVFACLFWIGTIFFFWRFDFADKNIVADRFMYLPSLGFCLLLGHLLSRFKAIAVVVLLMLGFLTYNQCEIWQNDLTLWTWILAHDPKNVLAKSNQEMAIYGGRKKAIDYKILTEAIDKAPLSAEKYLSRGGALLQESNYYLAFNDFDKAIKMDPANFMAYNMRGQLYALRGEVKKAMDDFNEAVILKPDNAIAYVQVASILKGMNDTNQSLAWYAKALQINPSMGEVYYKRGLLYFDLGNYQNAIMDFTRSISLKRELESSYFRRGKSYELLKQYDQAIADFYSALKEDPDDIKLMNEIGIVHLMSNNLDKALRIFNKTISLHPYYDNAYVNRGIIYIQQKQYDLALKDYSKAISLQLYPYHALITRGDIYFVMGQRQKALEDYNQAIPFSQGDPIAKMKRDQMVLQNKYTLNP